MATKQAKRSNIRMLHIPFSLLSQKEIDSNTLNTLRRNYFLPGHLEKVLLGKKFRSPADILRSAEIREAASPLELMKLVVPPKYDQPPIDPGVGLLSVEAMQLDGTHLVIELWNLAAGKHRILLAYPESELISIEMDGKGDVDPGTIRLGGFWWWEWPKLARETRELIYRRLVSDHAQADLLKLAQISPGTQPSLGSFALPVRKVAQLVVFFSSLTGTDSGGTGDLVPVTPGSSTIEERGAYNPDGMSSEEYESNKCTLSPDWPFARCCISHDYCYGENPRGCDECARLQCDLDFLHCMEMTAGSNPFLQEMAFIYFLAVRSFGGIKFEYCSSSPKLPLFGSIGLLGAVVGVTVSGSQGDLVGTLAGVITAGILSYVTTALACGTCMQLEDWVEECEADRKEREVRCEKLRRKCRKLRNPWKRLRCRLSFFWSCIVMDFILKGLCRLVKVVRPGFC